MDWNKWKCHCSSIGILMTEPRSAEEKKKGGLSQTAKSYLKEVYAEFKYGRREDFSSRYTEKGNLTEEACITLLSRLDKQLYVKNEEQLENDYLVGTPDIWLGENILKALYIIDNKSSWSMRTFMSVIDSPVDKNYWSQVQGYMDLTSAPEGEVSYCLEDCPEHLLNEEKRKLLYKMIDRLEAMTEISPSYI